MTSRPPFRSYPAVPPASAAPEQESLETQAPVPVPALVDPTVLIERRRMPRPIPVPQVIECDEEESWELWSHWSTLS